EEEAAELFLIFVAVVQFVDEANGEDDEGIGVVLARAADGVGKIAEQRKVQIGIGIGESADFKVLHQLTHLTLVEQQRRNGDHGGVVRRDAVSEVDFGQGQRAKDGGDGVVYQVNRALGGRDQQHEEGDGKAAEDGVIRDQRQKHRTDQQDGENLDAADEEVVGMAMQGGPNAIDDAWMIADAGFELFESLVDEVVADVRAAQVHARVANGLFLGCSGQLDG